MDQIHRIHEHLLGRQPSSVRRGLMDQINHNQRLIAIQGARGVGKTSFLLDYARDYSIAHGKDKSLYINLNQLCFTEKNIVDFAQEFVNEGGKLLLLDQVYKYPDWSTELSKCYELFPELKIIFTGSSVMCIGEDNEPLSRQCSSYKLNGFSLREFLNLKCGMSLPVINIEDILKNHQEIAEIITRDMHPMSWMPDYLKYGNYPFFLEQHNFSENLLKSINMMLEVDVLLIKQIDQRCLHKLRKLLYILSQDAPDRPNVSQLAKSIDTSRATVSNYLQYLADAQMISLLKKPEDDEKKKPGEYYLHNTNLSYVLNPRDLDKPSVERLKDIYATYFLSQVKARYQVDMDNKAKSRFFVDGKYHFAVEPVWDRHHTSSRYIAAGNIEIGSKNVIPLWMFGLLY